MPRIYQSMFALFLVSIIGCGLCSNTVVAEVGSPDGRLKATWFIRDCGATTDFVTLVSVHVAGSSFRDPADTVFIANGRWRLHMLWIEPRKLSIECEGCQQRDIFRLVARLGDIDVVFGSH